MSIRTLAAALAAAALWTAPVAAQSVVDYKGRRIQVGVGEASSQCLAMLRRAIDMTDTLKPRQKALAAEVKDLRCRPRPTADRTSDPQDSTIGVYTVSTPDDPSGFINFPIEAGGLSPADMVRSLVGNGENARRHHAYLAAKRRAATDPAAKAEASRLLGLFTGTDKAAVAKASCAKLGDDYEVAKALDMGERRLKALNRQMVDRGCG